MDKHETFQGETDIHTDFKEKMTYNDFLGHDTLISSQHLLSDHHDEMLFVTVHHESEMWMKLIIHELDASIIEVHADNLSASLKKLARVCQVQKQLKQVWDVLATLTPSEYIKLRDKLGQASGFQSYQNRMIEFMLGYKTTYIMKIYEKDPELKERLEQIYNATSIYDATIQAVARAGFPIDKAILNRDVSETHQSNESVKAAWMSI